MIQNFSIFKTKEKKNEKSPDYEISVNLGSKEQPKYQTIGGGWIKEGQAGKFISCSFSKAFKDRKEYCIDEVADPNVPKFERDSQGKPVGEPKTDDINPEDIPF